MNSLFKKLLRRSTPEPEAAVTPPPYYGMDDVTQTLLVPMMEEAEAPDAPHTLTTDCVEIASYMSVGTRKNQQDSVCFDADAEHAVCVLCDGMGGLSGGERASALAAEGVTKCLMNSTAEDVPTEMGRAAIRLNEKVKELCDDQNRKIEAGTTLTTVFIRGGMLYWCNVGDSHIYLYRNGTLEQLNVDHNLGTHLDQMVREGTMTLEDAKRHPQRAALTSYLGISELSLIGGNRKPLPLQPGDVLVQCSDGLYRCLSDAEIAQLLSGDADMASTAQTLVETALRVPGSHDNTTVVLTRVKG